MRWFRCPSSKTKAMLEAKATIGDNGLWQVACIVEEAQTQNIWEVDADTIVGWIKVKRDRAEKILPFAQKILSECQEIFSKSQKNLSKSKDFTPSNRLPDSTLIDKNRLDQIDHSPTPLGASERFEEFCKVYPKKRGKDEALTIWQTKGLDAIATQVIDSVQRARKSPQWQDQNGRYIPSLVNFLVDESWTTTTSNAKGKIQQILEAQEVEIRLDGDSCILLEGRALEWDPVGTVFTIGERTIYVDQIEITKGA